MFGWGPHVNWSWTGQSFVHFSACCITGIILAHTSQGLWARLFTGCLWHCSERCLNKKYSSGALCPVWESRTARWRGRCEGKQRHHPDISPSKTPKGFYGFGATPRHWRGVNHLTARRCAVDFEKSIKHIRLTGSGQGGRLQHLWDASVASSPLLTPGSGLSAPWWQHCCLQPALQFLGEGAAQCAGYWIAVGFLWCRSAPRGSPTGASSQPGCCTLSHRALAARCALQAKCSSQEVLNIRLRTPLTPLIMAPQFLQISTLPLIK